MWISSLGEVAPPEPQVWLTIHHFVGSWIQIQQLSTGWPPSCGPALLDIIANPTPLLAFLDSSKGCFPSSYLLLLESSSSYHSFSSFKGF